MVEFALPANSKIGAGKSWPAPDAAKITKTFRVYRWNPDDGENPRVDTYEVDVESCGPMPSRPFRSMLGASAIRPVDTAM